MNSGGNAIPTIDKPSDETLEKIDFVIQGLENGLFKDLSKKIDFHQKLKDGRTFPLYQESIRRY